MDKVLIGYVWLLSLLGAVFIGHEIAMSKTDAERSLANKRVEKCHRLLAKGLYE